MKITDYTILESNRPAELSFEVRRAIAEGWQPLGPLAIDSEPGVLPTLFQALVRYEPPGHPDAAPQGRRLPTVAEVREDLRTTPTPFTAGGYDNDGFHGGKI